MSDPAVEAAQQAGMCQFPPKARALAVDAARAMAKPIRELHREWEEVGILPPEAWQILDALAKLIYTSDELAEHRQG